MNLQLLGRQAKQASRVLACAGTQKKNDALLAIAELLIEHTDEILQQNQLDLEAGQKNGLSQSLLDRLRLTHDRIVQIAQGVREVAALNDPIGQIDRMWTRPNGLKIGKQRVPLGVIGIIFEARPNVTVDAAALCLKSGNVCILRGGKEAIHSNIALAGVMRKALSKIGLPEACIALIEDTSRQTATELMQLTEYLDVLIPRGGKGLIASVLQNATVPVIETGTGNCHIYVDRTADLAMADSILFNAKTSRPSVCNAAESLLVHRDVAKDFLPMCEKTLRQKHVELRACPVAMQYLTGAVPATEEDYYTEYNDYILSVKVVEDLDQAISHINQYSTGHSECIVTEDYRASERFLNEVDSAAVYVNASTRFTDGNMFGFGAEIGISTQKMHARGPMGLEELTSVKYIVYGNGQIRE